MFAFVIAVDDDADGRRRSAWTMKNMPSKTMGVCAAQRIVSTYLDLFFQRQVDCRPSVRQDDSRKSFVVDNC